MAEDTVDGCCDVCGSKFHATAAHPKPGTAVAFRWPPGYDPGEADRLIGRKPGS